MIPMILSLRDEQPVDEKFVRRLVIETVATELGADAWPEPMRSQLLEMQFASRRNGIRADFQSGRSSIIEADGEDAGWLVVADLEGEVRIVEIMVAASARGRGIGSAVLRQVLERAEHAGKPARLHVNAANMGAIRLYERLGFRRTGGDEVSYLMERRGQSG
jgi:ribosomal protein S18 acetylase RimI-like enzyme